MVPDKWKVSLIFQPTPASQNPVMLWMPPPHPTECWQDQVGSWSSLLNQLKQEVFPFLRWGDGSGAEQSTVVCSTPSRSRQQSLQHSSQVVSVWSSGEVSLYCNLASKTPNKVVQSRLLTPLLQISRSQWGGWVSTFTQDQWGKKKW